MEAALIALLIGWLLGIASQFVGIWFDRRRRWEQRAEEAANELLGMLNQAQALFRNAYRRDSEIDDDKLWEIVGSIRAKAVLLRGPARERINLVAEVLQDYWGAMQFTYGPPPSRVAFHVCKEGQESLRRVLHGEPLLTVSKEVVEYKDSIDQDRALHEEHMKDEAERRKKERTGHVEQDGN